MSRSWRGSVSTAGVTTAQRSWLGESTGGSLNREGVQISVTGSMLALFPKLRMTSYFTVPERQPGLYCRGWSPLDPSVIAGMIELFFFFKQKTAYEMIW